MNRTFGRTVARLVVLSLIVGLILSFFDISPQGLLRNMGATVEKIFSLVATFIEWSLSYILIGAIVVVPIWLILWLVRAAGDRKP